MSSEIPDWAHDLVAGEPEPTQILPSKRGLHVVRKEDTPDSVEEPEIEEPEATEESLEPLVLDGVVFPREASARIQKCSVEERKQWSADRLRARTDPIFLSEVLGMDLQEDPHRMLFRQLLTLRGPDFPLADLDSFHKKMVLWPRGLAKTTSVRVLMTQIVLNYPNARICFLTGSEPLAKRQLLAFKSGFENPTARFQYLFPEFCLKSIFNKKTKRWQDINPVMGTTKEFSVPARSTSVLAEPTFAISTAKSVKSGSHFDFLVIDDLVNDQNYQNAAALEKGYQQYIDLCPLLDPAGFLILTGTVYSYADCYARIQENAATIGELSVWKFSIRDCWSQGICKCCGHSDVFHDRSVNIVEPPCVSEGCSCKGFVSDCVKGCLFPRVGLPDGRLFGHTLEFLNQQKAEMGETKFANQYENRVIAVGQLTFTEALIGSVTLHHENQLPPPSLSKIYVVGDLAYSTSNDRDESVIFAFSKYAGALTVWGCWFGRWSANDRVETILNLLNRVRPETAFFEKNLNSDSLELNLISRAPSHGLAKLPIVWTPLSNHKDAKNIRIGDIEAAMKGKRLFLYSQMNGYDRLIEQLLKWPNLKHDDFADALAQCLTAPTGWQHDALPAQPAPAGSVQAWWKGLQDTPAEDAYYDNGCGTGFCC